MARRMLAAVGNPKDSWNRLARRSLSLARPPYLPGEHAAWFIAQDLTGQAQNGGCTTAGPSRLAELTAQRGAGTTWPQASQNGSRARRFYALDGFGATRTRHFVDSAAQMEDHVIIRSLD
ncbi:MAG: hypothetical protein FWD29_02155 [Micrococcales bacterium]|nr:hypothetical protein [Micrococcales bacterium]